MAKREWTDEQFLAVNTRYAADGESCNILVNAAAGSGKTAVLVERIIKKLLPSDENPNPTDVNKLLVVTFTNAAAAEMKERISEALAARAEKAETDGDLVLREYIKKQTSLLYDADITTIDAFCMKIVRENFHLLDIDPNFKVADNAQLMLMADETAEELFEECYEEENESFLRLAEIYSEGRDDNAVAEIIYEVYSFIRAMPNPKEWLFEKAEMYLSKDGILNNPWIKAIMKKKELLCAQACEIYEKAILYMAEFAAECEESPERITAQNPPGEPNTMQFLWGTCYETVCAEYSAAKRISAADWDESRYILKNLTFERWGKAAKVRDKELEITDKEQKSVVKAFRDEGKEILQKLGDMFFVSLDETEKQLSERVYPTAKAVAELTSLFDEKFKAKKDSKNVLDFSDLEHLCLKLFSENDEVCDALREKYEEILMDEYQDTNGLQEAIFEKISRGNNLFTVGDIKQSIYRFRRSDPMIFKKKSNSFINEEGASNRKIILSKNFRSRREVLDSVNDVFECIMSEAVGDVCYNSEQRLNTGNTTYKDMNGDICRGYVSECYLLEGQGEEEEEESVEKNEIEARFIAKKISEMKKNGFLVRDGDDYRRIRNRDITILMSSYKNVSEIYISALNKEGIECFAQTGGYFERNEVKTVMSLVKIIQNPYQDIPLLAILRSPVFRFTDSELAKIRTESEGAIYSCVKEAAKKGGDLPKKCADFLNTLNKWRDYTKYMDCARLLWTLYEETGIYAFVGALHGGDEAQANLRLLFERAKQYEASGYKGLFHFVRYMEKLERREEDLSAAKLVGEGHDVVRIMTIHKSKGLEFPVVFLAGGCKKFNIKPKKILLHKDLGFGLEEVNPEENYSMETAAKVAVSAAEKRESISEEERKLYVAMTRAKEKLIVTGVTDAVHSNIEKCEARWKSLISATDGKMSPEAVCAAVGFMDWIAPTAMKKKDNWYYEAVPYEPYFPDYAEEDECEEDITVQIENFKYPHSTLENVPTKISVTALKNSDKELKISKGDFELSEKPEFLKEKHAINSSERGTAIHYVMQKIIPSERIDDAHVSEFIKQMVEKGELDSELAKTVEVSKITAFYKSELASRLLKSKKTVREAPFETQIPLSIFENHKNSEETILLQGIIDCYFEEDDGIVLIDYKSDYYREEKELLQKYASQLELYRYAIEKITHKKVKESYIYAFHGNKAVLARSIT